MRLVGDAIQQGRSQIRISKYLRPVTKAKVRGDDHRFSLMAFGQNLEYQFRASLENGTYPNSSMISRP